MISGMRFVGISIVAVLLLGLFPQTVLAHSGGGPPFLLINGTYAQTNPYYLGGPQVPVSQDLPPEKYIVNEPLQLVIDTTKLQVPKDIIDQSSFRWSFYDGSKDYHYGTKLSYTYPKVGSFLMNLEVKGPQDQEYFLLDTVQMNIVPSQGYQLPTAKIATTDTKFLSGKPIHFVAQTTADPSSGIQSYHWYFSNQKAGQDQNPIYTYTEKLFVEYVFLQVVDKNGVAAIDAIQSVGTDGVIALSGLTPGSMTVPTVGPATHASVARLKPYLLPGLLGLVSISLLGLTIKKSLKKKT